MLRTFFFFNDTATTEIYTLSLHDALPISGAGISGSRVAVSLISLAVHSQPVSLAFGALGASQSVYSNFLSRGKDVNLSQNTPLEIGFAPPHEDAKKPAQAKP